MSITFLLCFLLFYSSSSFNLLVFRMFLLIRFLIVLSISNFLNNTYALLFLEPTQHSVKRFNISILRINSWFYTWHNISLKKCEVAPTLYSIPLFTDDSAFKILIIFPLLSSPISTKNQSDGRTSRTHYYTRPSPQ